MTISIEISNEKAAVLLEFYCQRNGIAIPENEKEAILGKIILFEQLKLYSEIEREKAMRPVEKALKADTEMKAVTEDLNSKIQAELEAKSKNG